MSAAAEIIPVALGERSYEIHVGDGLLSQAGERTRAALSPSRVVVVADENVAPLYAERVLRSYASAGLAVELVTFPAGEDSKCLARASLLYDRLFALGLDRKSALAALGGGVTGDLAGFVAATFLRGIPFVQMPTTLLAQVDSSSGGKTGVNHPRGKNLIGVFHQPSLVFADVGTLTTLPVEELRSGLAEVVKHGAIRDEAYFHLTESSASALLKRESNALTKIVAGSCRIKGAVVAADEREAGVRALLNFGHTFGHAFESLSHYALRHGEAVALGMLAACRLGETLGRCGPEAGARLRGLLDALGLPLRAPRFPTDALVDSMRGDKKTERGTFRFVLLRRIGEAEIVPVSDFAAVRDALEFVMQ